jgi:hypothetical protein
LPTNGDSLQGLLVASERQMLYNSFHNAKLIYNKCLRASHFEIGDTVNFSGILKAI